MKFFTKILSILLVIATLSALPAGAQVETPIYNFRGAGTESSLVFHGNKVYGTTYSGGVAKLGTVFQLKLVPDQTLWKKKTLHSFTGPNDEDGSTPSGGVIRDHAGNLYVATEFFDISCCGAVFKLAPPAAGQTGWTETLLHFFTGGSDGDQPVGGLTMDSAGALYGSTVEGGSSGRGTVFKLTPPAAGQTAWTENILFSFTGGNDGGGPNGDLLLDKSGALLGTTVGGGLFGDGTVFMLTPPAAGQTNWTESIIHNFEGESDSSFPNGGLIGGIGDIFGTTQGPQGVETSDFGIVFELRQEILGNPVYTMEVLHAFTESPDGANPRSGLFRDASGNIWGTTLSGGDALGDGTIYKLAPKPPLPDQWKYELVHTFSGSTTDGGWPYSRLTADPTGTLYGTNAIGGMFGDGTVYQLVP